MNEPVVHVSDSETVLSPNPIHQFVDSHEEISNIQAPHPASETVITEAEVAGTESTRTPPEQPENELHPDLSCINVNDVDHTFDHAEGNENLDEPVDEQPDDGHGEDDSEGSFYYYLLLSKLRFFLLICKVFIGYSSFTGSEPDAEDADTNVFVPKWRLQNNLRIDSCYTSRELISHLATPTEQAAMSELTNSEVLV